MKYTLALALMGLAQVTARPKKIPPLVTADAENFGVPAKCSFVYGGKKSSNDERVELELQCTCSHSVFSHYFCRLIFTLPQIPTSSPST